MAKPAARIAVIQFCFGLGIMAVLARAAQLQLVEGDRWEREARAQRTERVVLPARRGALYDRHGLPLAITQEFYHVGIAPNEVTDRRAVVRAVGRLPDLSQREVERDLAGSRRWIYYHGPFNATDVQPLRELRGVHLTGEYLRFYPSRNLARPIVGRLGADSAVGASGLELSLDSLVTGIPGEAVLLKDRAGRRYDSPSRLIREPVAGHDVVLTIDTELQEIAERGLDEALTAMDAEGGDIVFLDPSTGELLALASRQGGPGSHRAVRASTFTDPFEPGSTAKLFTAAALLVHRRVDSTDAVSGENGVWEMPTNSKGRVRRITDSHKTEGTLTLAQAVEVSSNIAMAKFALRLTSEEQYEMLRDFGFGSPTGAEFPSESRGRLALPDKWQPMYTRASMAMGYELGVTPVQLAAAYGAIANDGILLTPTLVREIRDAEGTVLYTHQPEPVRRVLPSEIAAKLREYLRGAAGEDGTGGQAQLVNYTLLGKTGTAVRFEDGHYVRGQYTASFAALFPADEPQLVVIVKIDNPRGPYYGGLTAAPLTRTMLQQALAARRVAIDRARLAPETIDVAQPAAKAPVSAPAPLGTRTAVLPWPYTPVDSAAATVPVPDVTGESVRAAALALHRRGLEVSLRGAGRVLRTEPAAGTPVDEGATVTVWAGE